MRLSFLALLPLLAAASRDRVPEATPSAAGQLPAPRRHP